MALSHPPTHTGCEVFRPLIQTISQQFVRCYSYIYILYGFLHEKALV